MTIKSPNSASSVSEAHTLNLSSEGISAAYDQVEYDSGLILETHPCQLGGIASLFGVEAPEVNGAKILEVGSALGQNLIAIAASLPSALCVGVDISASQVEHAQREADSLGLSNVVFITANILELISELSGFDYIICHGVYSWIPPEVRVALLPTLREMLAPRGLIYVSYNTLPGWSDCGLIRDLARRLSPGQAWSADQVEQLDQWIQALPSGVIKRRYEQLWFGVFRDQPDFYKRHGVFAEFNEPRFLQDVVNDAEACGLTYISDISLQRDLPDAEYHALHQLTEDRSRIERLQLLDLARHTTFRASIFGHTIEGRTLDLQVTSLSRLSIHSHLILDPQYDHLALLEGAPQGAFYQGRSRAFNEPVHLSAPLLIDLIGEANRVWPAPLSLKPQFASLSPQSIGELMSQIVVLVTHEHLSLYLDTPETTPYRLGDLASPPRLSQYNAYQIQAGAYHLTTCGLHRATHALQDHPWFPFSDLFNGIRDADELLSTLRVDPRYAHSPLAGLSPAQQRSSLEEGLELFRRHGFI